MVVEYTGERVRPVVADVREEQVLVSCRVLPLR
jgi:hypothetical protein